MSNHTFMLAFTVGAGLLALWVHARFPSLAPERLPRALLHAILAFAILKVTPGLLGETVSIAGVFLVVLPALIYALLGSLWILKQAQTAFGMR